MASDKERLDRDQQLLNRLAKIEHKVDALEQTTAFALRADAEKHLGPVRAIFSRGKRRAQIYLAADGGRSVQEIAAHPDMKPPNVSRELVRLADDGLVELVETTGNTSIYGKTPLDRTLQISRFLCKEYKLGSDGKAS